MKGESLLSCDATEYSSGTKLQLSDQRKALNKVIFYLENGNEVFTYLKNTVVKNNYLDFNEHRYKYILTDITFGY